MLKIEESSLPPIIVVNCIFPFFPFLSLLSFTMPHLAGASSSLLRACSRQQLPTTSTIVAACQHRNVSKSSFDSPFGRSHESSPTLKIPDFSKYASKRSPTSNKVFSYFVAGSLGLASAVGAKATVQGTVFWFIEVSNTSGEQNPGPSWIMPGFRKSQC